MFGGQAFPAIGEDGRLTLTLGSHDFFWLRLRSGPDLMAGTGKAALAGKQNPYTTALPVITPAMSAGDPMTIDRTPPR